MLLSRSIRRKVVVTCGAILGFSLLYEATTIDSRYAAQQAELREDTAVPAPGLRLRFQATAYCKGETTAAGTAARSGVAAADPSLLPVGSVVQVESLGPKYNGVYTVMDTGPSVTGRLLDIYMWSCNEALAFGRRPVQLRVLRLGWNPQASGRRADVLFQSREQQQPERSAAPSPTPAPTPGAKPPGTSAPPRSTPAPARPPGSGPPQ